MTKMEMALSKVSTLLNDPNCFMYDTGAISDAMLYNFNFMNVKQTSSVDSIVDASGNQMKAEKIDDIKEIICDQYGQDIQRAIVRDIVYLLGSTYNLLSILKGLEDRCKISRDINDIKLVKGKARLTFNIKIKTAKGVIYCVYFKRNS